MRFKTSMLLVYTFILMITLNVFCTAYNPEELSTTNEISKYISKSVKSTSGWSDDMRLTYYTAPDPAPRAYAPNIAVEDQNVYIVWQESWGSGLGTYGEIRFMKSTDNGKTWGNIVNLTEDDGNYSMIPKVAVNGSNVYVVWEDTRDCKAEIYFKKSNDYGNIWNEEKRLSIDDCNTSAKPEIAVSGSTIHVIWREDTAVFPYWCEIFYVRSVDDGVTWDDGQGNIDQPRQITFPPENTATGGEIGGVVAVGSNIHVMGGRSYHFQEGVVEWDEFCVIYFNSTDNGETWSDEKIISRVDRHYSGPGWDIGANGSNIHVVWEDAGYIDESPEGYEIVGRNSTDNGITWNNEIRLTNHINRSEQPRTAVDGDNIHVAWIDNRDHYPYEDAFEIYYINSTDGGKTWSDETRLTYAKNDSVMPAIATANGYTHLVFLDNRTGDDHDMEIYYKRYPDFSMVPTKLTITANPSSLTADGTSISTITATVTNEPGDPVEGVTVSFTIESGCGSLSSDSNITDANGIATTTYTAGTKAGDVIIKAVVNGISNTTTITLTAGNPAHISISANPNMIIADGMSTSTITVIVTDQYGNSVPNTVVYFVNETGIGIINPISNTTNTNGITSAVYTAGTILGNEIINVTCDYIWNTTVIHLVSGPIAEIFIYPSGPIDLYTGDIQQFTAVGYDQYGNLNTSWHPFWHVDGDIGVINSTGFFTATKKGSGAVNCTDNVTGVYNIIIINVLNRKPSLDPIGNQTAYEGQLFTLQINAFDPDNDTITFSDNSTLFNINSTTGLISFTPSYDSAGIYLINIMVCDGIDTAWQTFKLTIINVNRPPIATISSPLDNAKFTTKDNIFFDGTGSSDPDGDGLTYSWFSSVDGSIGSTASFSRKLSKGTHMITLTVDDGQGETDTKQITITVKKPSEPSGGFIPGFETALLTFVCLLAIIVILLRRRKT